MMIERGMDTYLRLSLADAGPAHLMWVVWTLVGLGVSLLAFMWTWYAFGRLFPRFWRLFSHPFRRALTKVEVDPPLIKADIYVGGEGSVSYGLDRVVTIRWKDGKITVTE